jgi:Adenylate and Guanylate cyclase catalytic domain
MDHS